MATPEDLLAQRNKIQREILALESTLGADGSIVDFLSSDSDSDNSVSDDGGYAEGQVVKDELEAERLQILQEIQQLEQTLGPNAALVDALTDSEQDTDSQTDTSDEDSDDEEELCLPQDAETCLQINLVYQDVLREKLADLERMLNENRQQQGDIEAQLSGPSSTSKQPHSKVFLGSFMKPYFKDKLTGLGPPSNEETRERLNHGTRPCDEMKIRRWNGWHKTLLIDSVVKDTMKRMLQPKLSKVEYLTSKLSKVDDKEKEELKKQIAGLEKDIKDISSMKEHQLYGNRCDDHDWEKISYIDFEGLRHPEDLMRFWQNYLHPGINKSTWNQDEIQNLGAIVGKYKFCHWDQIAEALGTNRSAFMCFQTYQRYLSKTFRRRIWDKDEDQVLRDLVDKMRIGSFIPYTQMSYFMEGRDHAQLMYRWTTVLDPSLKKGSWSKEEDQLLIKAVEKYGCKDWYKIRQEVPGRTDSACRDRYMDCLREDVKRGTWSDEEVELLKKLVEKYGVGKWSKIASEIPNRIDCQCMNKWKGLVQLAEKKQGIKRDLENPDRCSKSKKRKVIKKKTEEEEEEEEEVETDSTSEDENEKVEYLDSDVEEAGGDDIDVHSEDELEHREEYIQPDIKDWIPAGGNARVRPAGTVRTILVLLPTEDEQQDCGKDTGEKVASTSLKPLNPVRSTVVDCLGNSIKTYVGIETPALPAWDCCNENAMEKVPVEDIRYLFTWSKKNHKNRGIRKTKKTPSSEEVEKNEQSYGQETKGIRQRRPRNVSDAHAKLHYALMSAVIPWVGNVLMPQHSSKKRVCQADIVQRRAAVVSLPKTAVFLLFLKALHIDADGCKKVIDARSAFKSQSPSVKYIRTCNSSSPRPLSESVTESICQTAKQYSPSSSRAISVAKLLSMRNQQKNHPQPAPSPETERSPPPPAKLPIPRYKPQSKPRRASQSAVQITGPTLMVPPAFITQSKTHQGWATPQPVGQGILPLLQSHGSLDVCKQVLQLVVPVQPQALTKPEVPSTTLTFRPSTTASPTKTLVEAKSPKKATPITSTSSTSSGSSPVKSSGEAKTPKRICRPTVKAQALMEDVKVKASKKRKVKNTNGQSDATAKLPQTTAWIWTPTGLLPLGGIHISPNIGPNVSLEPPVMVNQNSHFVLVNGVQPTNPIAVSPVPVLAGTDVKSPTDGKNLQGQDPQISTAPNQPNLSSLPSINEDPNVSSSTVTYIANMSTCNSSPAVQSKASCSQKQPVLSIVPQMTIQSPLIVNQNGSLTVLCDSVRPTVPLNSSVASSVAATSVPLSGLNTTEGSSPTSVNNVLSFSSASAVTREPAVCPEILALCSPVVQMPSPTFPGSWNKTIPCPQLVFQQPVTVKQNGSVQLSDAKSSGTKSVSPAYFPNAAKVTPAAQSKNPSVSAKEIRKDSTASPVNNNIVILSSNSATKTCRVPSDPTSSVSAAPQEKSSVLIQRSLRVQSLPKGPLHVKKNIGNATLSCNSLPKTQASQAKRQPLQPAVAASNPNPNPNPGRDPLQFDPSLMFFEHPDQVRDWIKGNNGISLPYLEDKMPYLPPFVSSLNTLASLLKSKESFLKAAVQLLPNEDQGSSGEEEKVAAVRELVSNKFKSNPAYLLLKSRFLSCFTLPALLATIHPCQESQGGDVGEEAANGSDVLQTVESLLSTNECETIDAQFSDGERMQNDHTAPR